jgi:hypothetical protein
MTGGTTHWKLVLLPHAFAWRPLSPKKNRPSFWPSPLLASKVKPEGALALGVPVVDSRNWQPEAEKPAVQ